MMHRKNYHVAGLLLLSLCLVACSVFGPVTSEPATEYEISAVPNIVKHHKAQRGTIAVSLPVTSAMYQSNEMLYSTENYRINRFAKNRWVEPPAQMLQPLLIETLQKTGHFRAVIPLKALAKTDLVLNTQLFAFHQVFFKNSSLFRLMLRAQLVNEATGAIVTSRSFAIDVPATQQNPYGGVVAANGAVSSILTQLAAWIVGVNES